MKKSSLEKGIYLVRIVARVKTTDPHPQQNKKIHIAGAYYLVDTILNDLFTVSNQVVNRYI